MKKFLLILLLLLLPFSVARAYPGETKGFGLLRWGMSVSDVKHLYHDAVPVKKINSDFADTVWVVTIPDAHGEMGIDSEVFAACYFSDNRLITIQLPIDGDTEDIDTIRSHQLSRMISLYGIPDIENEQGSTIWEGVVTSIYLSPGIVMKGNKSVFFITLLDMQSGIKNLRENKDKEALVREG